MRRLLFLIYISFLLSPLTAQNVYDTDQFFREGRNFYTNVKNWETIDVLKLLVTGGVTYGVLQYDAYLSKEIKKPEWFGKSGAALFGRFYGEPVTPGVLSAYFIIQGNSTGNKANKKLGFELAQATLYAGTITTVLKYIFGRERPATTGSPYEFDLLSFRNNDFLSLPSGHTTIAFAMSTVLSENSDSQFWQIASFLPAMITAVSRVYENRHWPSDVVLGAAIGYFSAKYFTNRHSFNEKNFPEERKELFSISVPID